MPGRTGHRRYTLAEAELVGGPRAVARHKRQYGRSAADADAGKLGPPPAWFSSELIAIWTGVVATAQPGLLAAPDHPGMVAYVAAIAQHHRLARQFAANNLPLEKKAAAELRFAARALFEAGRYLGVPISERQKVTLPEPISPMAPASRGWDELRRFPMIDGGKTT